MEHMSSRPILPVESPVGAKEVATESEAAFVSATTNSTIQVPTQEVEAAAPAGVDVRKLLVNQASRQNIAMDVQDGTVIADEEAVSQVLQAMGQRYAGWNPHLEGTHGDGNYTIRLIADGVCLNSAELEYVSRANASVEGVDINIVMAVDLAREEGLSFRAANRKGSDGSVIGSEAIIDLVAVSNRNLTNIVRGKKRDLEKQLRNLMN
jgi:hypothetical protein